MKDTLAKANCRATFNNPRLKSWVIQEQEELALAKVHHRPLLCKVRDFAA